LKILIVIGIFEEADYGNSFKLMPISNGWLALKSPYLRRSYQSRRHVSAIIAEAFPKTLLLAIHQ